MLEDDSYKANNVHKDLYEALQKSLELDYSNQRLADQEEACKKRRKRRDEPRSPPGSPPSQPPPPPPPAGASGALGAQELSPSDDLMHDDSAPKKQVQVSDDQDSKDDHTIAPTDSRKDWWKPLPEEERPTTPKPAWTILPSNVSDVENNWASAFASSYETPDENHCCSRWRHDDLFLNVADWWSVTRLLTGSGWTGHNTEGDGSMPVLSISKMKAARYPDFGLELLVPEQTWTEDVCTYDLSAK
ncbi:hypothetical protein Tco_1523862 [Tanacetum coccineum]